MQRRGLEIGFLGALVLSLLTETGTGRSPALAADADDICVDGWRNVTFRGDVVPQDVEVTSANKVWIVGGALGSGGKRRTAVLTSNDERWKRIATVAPATRDSGFMGVASSGPAAGLWAVGFAREPTWLGAFVARRHRSQWSQAKVLRPAPGGAALTDADASRQRGTWAVGYRQGRPGNQRPWILHRLRGRWAASTAPLKSGERATLSGVSVSDAAGVWAVGSSIRRASVRPYMVRRSANRWKRQVLPVVGQAVLADIAMLSAHEGWAIGHRFEDGRLVPLVLRWDGNTWREVPPPEADPDATLLTGVAVTPGSVTIVGSAWDRTRRRFVALAAQREGNGWRVSVGPASWGEGSLNAVDGDGAGSGWVVGRIGPGLIARVCVPTPPGPAAKLERRERRREARAAGSDEGALPTPEFQVRPSSTLSDPARPLDVGLAPAGLKVRDRASSVGLPRTSLSYGAVIADFDGNGRDDIFLGKHGGVATLFLWQGGRFVDAGVRFRNGDRHGCAAADVDGSGLPDLYCSFGASRGTTTKSNQLWLDPAGPNPRLHPLAGGALEPYGRGRLVHFIDVDEDGDHDLLVGQETKRMDGLPSLNRFYERIGAASFRLRRAPGLDTGLSAWAIDSGDVDGDGRTDVLFVYFDPRAAEPRSGIRLYRNLAGTTFRNLTRAYGIRSIGERDAELARLDGDGRLDLVQLSEDRVRVSLQRGGRYRTVYERGISRAVAFASGDADGDGDRDLYVLRKQRVSGDFDVLLLNSGNGRSWRAIAVRKGKLTAGQADDVIALDYDRNGRTDFLVLNGINNQQGRLRLISIEG